MLRCAICSKRCFEGLLDPSSTRFQCCAHPYISTQYQYSVLVQTTGTSGIFHSKLAYGIGADCEVTPWIGMLCYNDGMIFHSSKRQHVVTYPCPSRTFFVYRAGMAWFRRQPTSCVNVIIFYSRTSAKPALYDLKKIVSVVVVVVLMSCCHFQMITLDAESWYGD